MRAPLLSAGVLAAACCAAALASPAETALPGPDCAASDAALQQLQWRVCSSLVGQGVAWCPFPPNVTAEEDWPNQAVYMNELLSALAAPATCLGTPTARAVVVWLNTSQAGPNVSGAFMNTWVVFQAQYYDMPRAPGERIEAPDTLGRKCWAFAYLAQMWAAEAAALASALAAAGLSAAAYADAAAAAIPRTMELCEQVMANCFVNSTYTPSRNGSCALDIFAFRYLGFERENTLRANVVNYPFF